jgi:hypothetical protein
MSLFRRTGAQLLRIIESVLDPAAEAGRIILYGKNSGGATKLFMRNSAGTVSEVGSGNGTFSPPERWIYSNVPANQTLTMFAQVSTEFDSVKMIRNGSITGLATHLTEAILTGTLTVTVTKNGSPTGLSLVHSSGTGSQVAHVVEAYTYVAGDLIGLQLTTSSGFTPTTTDLEAWIECSEIAAGAPNALVMAIGSTVASATDGSVLYANGSTLGQDNSNLFFDDTNKRLGVGTGAPGTSVDISSPSTIAALALRSGSTAATSAAGTGRIRFNELTNKIQASENGGGYADIGSGSGGSGGITSGVSVYHSTTQASTTAVWLLLTYDSELYDTNSYHSTVTNPSRMTAPVTGYYYVRGSAQWATSSSGSRHLTITKNAAGVVGVNTQLYGSHPAHATFPTQNQISGMVYLVAGDYLELFAYQDSGSGLAITKDTSNPFQMQLIDGGGAEFSGAQVYKSVVQSIPNATWTLATWDTEAFDTNGYHSTVTNPSRMTAPVTGYYLIMASIGWAANTTGIRYVQFYKNGAGVLAGGTTLLYQPRLGSESGGTDAVQTVSQLAYLTAGEHVEMFVHQSSGGALNLLALPHLNFSMTAITGSSGSPIVTSTVLGAPASTISVSGLDGDTDREYEIELNYLATGTGAHDVDIRPNGDTGANRQTTRVYNGSTGTSFTSTTGGFAANGAVAGAVSIRATFSCFVYRDPAITYYRRFTGESVLAFDSGAGTGVWDSSTTYASNVSNLTSLAFGITNVQFATGSELIVRKRVR